MSNVERRDLRPARRPFGSRAVVSDLDDVVHRGEAPIPGAVEAFQNWHRTGVRYALVTDNSTRSAASVAENWPRGTFVHVLGAPALVDVASEAGFVESRNGRFRDECLNEHLFRRLPHRGPDRR